MRPACSRAIVGILAATLAVGCAPPQAAVPPPPPAGPGTAPQAWSPSLAEQLRVGWFDYERLGDSIPGFGGVSAEACSMVVYLTHPERDAERARAILQPALTRGEDCVAAFRTERAGYTWKEMRDLSDRVASRLGEWQLWPRGGAGIERDRVVIRAHNERVLNAIRKRLAQDASLPADRIVVTLLPGPMEADGPVTPPAGAYLVALDSVASRVRSTLAARRVFVDTAGLPDGVRASDLRARGFEPKGPAYRCGADAIISFLEPRLFEDGRYRLATMEFLIPELTSMSSDYEYDVVCESGTCRVTRGRHGLGDRVSVCPVPAPG